MDKGDGGLFGLFIELLGIWIGVMYLKIWRNDDNGWVWIGSKDELNFVEKR